MQRFVISAPRSGMNWLRFCAEEFYGRRTQGKTSQIDRGADAREAFRRSHDALNLSRRRRRGAWQRLDPAEVNAARLVLILRDPLETYVRAAHRRFGDFRCYAGNIRFYAASRAEKAVFYYEDLVADPDVMADLLYFLDIPPAPGHAAPTRDALRARWAELGAKSRAMYDTKQAVGGGSQTKERPTDFSYHQRALTDAQKARVWMFLQGRLGPDELALLERYAPEAMPGAPGLRDRLRFLY